MAPSRRPRWPVVALAGLALLATTALVPAARQADTVAITHATVLTMGPAGRLRDQTVIVRDGMIVGIGPSSRLEAPPGARVIEERGRFIMPALADMHAHNLVRDRWLFLGYGIGTVRGMWGVPSQAALQDSIEAGQAIGPRFHIASPGIDARPGRWPLTQFVDSLSEVEPTVARLAAEGWRWLKIYSSLSRPVYDSVVRSARRHGIRFLGHVPFAVPVEHALEQGQLTIEHLGGYERAMSGRAGPGGWAAAGSARDTELVRRTVAAGTWNCPTMAILDAINRTGNPGLYPALATRRREFLSALYRGGARLLVGTDSGIDIVPAGAALSAELAQFVAAGIPADTALRLATIGAAEFLGEADRRGTVEAGKEADLLLLDADPALDFGTLREPAGLVLRGEWYPAERLAAWRAGRP